MRRSRERSPRMKQREQRSNASDYDIDELEVRDPSQVRDHKSWVFYGRAGTGKTTLSATFPKPLLLLDCNDQGDESVFGVKGVKVKDVTDWETAELVYWYLRKNNKEEYQTVVIDTVSQLQMIAMAKVVQDKKIQGRAGDWGVMKKRDWGDIAGMMKDIITDYRDLPMNVVFLAQDRIFNFDDEESDEDADLQPEVGPRLMPSVASHLNASVSFIGNTYIRHRTVEKEVRGKKKRVQRTEYCLRVGPNPIYITKVRKPKKIELPSLIVDPTYDDMADLIKGE